MPDHGGSNSVSLATPYTLRVSIIQYVRKYILVDTETDSNHRQSYRCQLQGHMTSAVYQELRPHQADLLTELLCLHL